MKFGWCSGIDNFKLAERLGFDYFETPLSALASLDDEEFSRVREMVDASAIKVEAVNVMFGDGFTLVGPNADIAAAVAYLDPALARAAQLGCEVCVFGSGKARIAPEKYPESAIMHELRELGVKMGELGRRHGITICVEPLNHTETNTINYLSDARALVGMIGSTYFKLTADWYHIRIEGDRGGDVLAAAPMIGHTHIANPETRRVPKKNDGEAYDIFFSALKRGSYLNRVSFEGRLDDPESELAEMLAYLRSIDV